MILRLFYLALAFAVTAALLWYIATPQTAGALVQAVEHGDWRLLAMALALNAGVQWLRAWRFAIMMEGGIAFPDARLVRITFQLNFFNFLLPFKLGELSYPLQMRRVYGQPLLKAAGTLLLARLFDLASVVAILLLSAASLGFGGSGIGNAAYWISGVGVIVLPSILLLAGSRILARNTIPAWLGRVTTPILDAMSSLRDLKALFAAILLSFLVWLTFGLLSMLTAAAVVDSVSPVVAIFGAAASNLAFALPINGIAGLGPTQAAWVFAVAHAGVPWGDAVVTALTLYSVSLVTAMLCGGIAMIGRGGIFPGSEIKKPTPLEP
jgi:uncharacterized protein (TIRG00374 family)